MSNLERDPVELILITGDTDRVQVPVPREVPFGGPRGMTYAGRFRSGSVAGWCLLLPRPLRS